MLRTVWTASFFAIGMSTYELILDQVTLPQLGTPLEPCTRPTQARTGPLSPGRTPSEPLNQRTPHPTQVRTPGSPNTGAHARVPSTTPRPLGPSGPVIQYRRARPGPQPPDSDLRRRYS